MKGDISKEDLYESVKTLVECEIPHIHLNQHKLFTLFSIAFQYILFQSTKNPGAYILRIEDSQLADKLAKKSKDPSTRKFLQSLLVPRKLKYGKSMFFLDFFHIGSWNLTKDIKSEKLKGAIIVKNTSSKPMEFIDTEEGEEDIMANLPKDYFLTTLQENMPKTITIAFEQEFENVESLSFPFIKKSKPQSISGVTIGKDIDWDTFD
ncbi:hypothetical protein BIY24_09820 [Halobacteriovorax marinus]|uniref:Uncharacterized protein n=1 Tax=Halobacteriovorax marinus (strain ATCC BAA-682 / DSM 15412 / SJ) TaxID=862908 RepID=E1X374_HALMS|nr:hypothetical protein [Halobacteriovorax marinus]ATH08236.1 hypothetical protein BIY24_09820 [Halobacteriovorax marinus]CBW26904.1 hypothetical protein BMS_2093 [Halobacteriovorax marinus SJ]